MSRIRLPNRRQGHTFDIPHPNSNGITYAVQIGFDEEGAVKELFIACNKLTTSMDIAAIEIATLVSIALQHGVSLSEVAAAMPRDEKGFAQGAAGAVLDAVIEELKLCMPLSETAA